MSDVVALIYRAGCTACGRSCCRHAKGGGRQYAFGSVAELESWCSRRPYVAEVVKVIPVGADRKVGEMSIMPAVEAAAWVAKWLVEKGGA